MVKQHRILAWVLSLALVFSTLSSAVLCSAESPSVIVRYAFSGRESALPGYAEGQVTMTSRSIAKGYYILYWANDSGILPGYEKIAAVPVVSDASTTYDMVENMAIPEGATKLAVFAATGTEPTSTDIAEAAVYTIPEDKRFQSGKQEMTFASVSDVHVNYNSSDPNSDNYCGAPEKWTAALNYFADLKLDMVVISGDCTGGGHASEYTTYKASIEASNYDANKIYMARGNHDSQENANFINYTGHSDMIRPFDDSPWFYVLKKGEQGEKNNLFIFLAQELSSISNTPNQDNFSTWQLDWLEGLLSTYSGTNTNIFILEHAFYHNWGPGDRYNGVYVQPMHLKDSFSGNMRLQSLLMEYKEAVFMTGHSHIAFSEMVNYSDENGTACRMIHNSSTSQLRTYTSSGSISYRAEGRVDNKNGSEGYVVGVYANDIVYNGTNLTTREKIPTACYIFPSYTEDRSAAASIAVTRQPNQTKYNAGEFFNAAGMEITATYADGSTAVVQGWGLKNNLSLGDNAKEVVVTYGDLEVSVPIHISRITDVFEGSGTKADPFLIQSASDFAHLTACFATIKGSSSNDATTFGAGMFFRQTADIDMTGYAGYTGTQANGSSKYGFSGVYDGNGYTIRVALNESNRSDVSIFPYLNGVVMNTRFAGSITGKSNVQPIRTIGKNGLVLNCDSEMQITSNDYSCGLSLSNYGTVIQYSSRCALSGPHCYAYSKLDSDSYSYSDSYHYCTDSGSLLASSNGTQSDDVSVIADDFNNHKKASITAAVERLQKYDSSYTDEAICLWNSEDGKLTAIHIPYAPVDRTPPTITIQPSFDASKVLQSDDATVTITAEDEGGIDSVTYQIGTADAVTVTAEELPIVLNNLPDGEYSIRVTAIDKVGNRAEESLSIRKESKAEVLLGDVNADGLLTVADVVALRQLILNGSGSEYELAVGNVDQEGLITVSDVVLLRSNIISGKRPTITIPADLIPVHADVA